MRSLLPDTPYGHDSGGDPQEIPSLTYEQFLEFHRRYYHPRNARIFLYGNIETERYLEFLEREFLSAFEPTAERSPGSESSAPAGAGAGIAGPGGAGAAGARPAGTAPEGTGDIPLQPRWSRPETLTRTYPVEDEDEEARSSVTVNWLLPPVDPFWTLAFEVLAELLIGHSGSPLYRAIAESPLGEDLSAPTGLETELREMGFSVGMRGTEAERAKQIEELIFGELKRLVREGIDPGLVTAALRSVEFRNREIRGGPFGLRLMRRALRGWIHGRAPEETLEFARWFEELKERVEREPRFLEQLIEDHLLENPHRTTLIVVPDAEEARRRREEEAADLERAAKRMSESEREEVTAAQERLLKLQSEPDSPGDVAKLPSLTVDDLPRAVDRIPSERTSIAGVPALVHRYFTNGVVYVDLAFDVDEVPDELEDYLMLFSSVATECGLTDMAYEDLARELATHTGGLSFRLDASTRADDESALERYLFVRLKALPQSLSEAFELLHGVLSRPHFGNHERLASVLRELRNDFRSSVLPAGHSYVSLRSARGLSRVAEVEERWKGLSQLLFLEELAEKEIETVAARLEELRRAVVSKAGMQLALASEEEVAESVRARTAEFLEQLPEGEAAAAGDLSPGSAAEAPNARPSAARNPAPETPASASAADARFESVLVTASVNYVGASIRAAHLEEPEYVPESVLAHLLRTGFLWEEIRMKGGAYGAMAGIRALERVFSFASYRDPRITETIESFGRALSEVSEHGIDPAELELAIISGVGRDSRPLSPGQKSIVSLKRHLYGITDELRQRIRDRLIAADVDQVREAGSRLAGRFDAARVSVMGSREAVEEAAADYPEILEHTLELHL
jgi:hypothetical protein